MVKSKFRLAAEWVGLALLGVLGVVLAILGLRRKKEKLPHEKEALRQEGIVKDALHQEATLARDRVGIHEEITKVDHKLAAIPPTKPETPGSIAEAFNQREKERNPK